jgi:hypothetical protein
MSSFSINLSTAVSYNGSLTVQTKQQPVFSLNNNGLIRTRVEPDYQLKDRYYTMPWVANTSQTQYTFTLIDYTGQCLGPLTMYSTINDNLDIIDSSNFDPNRIAYAWLDNSTGYDIRVGCLNNGVRDFGTWILGSTQSRNIEVTNVPLNPAATVYDGGFIPSFTGNGTNTIIFTYTKATGIVSSINYTIQDISIQPPTVDYSTQLTDTANGQVNFNMGNGTYYATMVAVNNGQTINMANVFIPAKVNQTTTTLPPTILGSSSDWVYKSGALIGMVVIGLGWAAIDAGYGSMAMIAWILFMANAPRFDGVTGWINVPSWLQVTIGLMGLGLLWGMNRRHDE